MIVVGSSISVISSKEFISMFIVRSGEGLDGCHNNHHPITIDVSGNGLLRHVAVSNRQTSNLSCPGVR